MATAFNPFTLTSTTTNVGKVKKVERSPGGGLKAEIELDERYAPIHKDARLILRPKSLLGLK